MILLRNALLSGTKTNVCRNFPQIFDLWKFVDLEQVYTYKWHHFCPARAQPLNQSWALWELATFEAAEADASSHWAHWPPLQLRSQSQTGGVWAQHVRIQRCANQGRSSEFQARPFSLPATSRHSGAQVSLFSPTPPQILNICSWQTPGACGSPNNLQIWTGQR